MEKGIKMNKIIKRNCAFCEKKFECRSNGNRGKAHRGKIFRGINAITCSSKCSKEYGKRNKKEDLGICIKCNKNKATIRFTNSVTDFAHGFINNICQQCYDEIRNKNPWFKEGEIIGREEQKKKDVKIVDEIYGQLENDDKTWCKHIKIIQREIKKRINKKK